MIVALVGRTLILTGWLLGVLWHGIGRPAGVALALALLLVWVVSLARDRRIARTAHGPVDGG